MKRTRNFFRVTFIILLVLMLYLFKSTYSGVWYDEAIEYFFSRFIAGTLPIDFGKTTNMYQRICNTYQPPLYNFLMYFWLKIYDTELWFRLFGIIVTIIGTIGIYSCINKVANDKWASLGSILYALTSKVSYYGLECGEYNLMLCFLSWSVYFFISVLSNHSKRDYFYFFLFSILAVYSQYGSTFIVAGMYITELIDIIKNYKSLFLYYIKLTLTTLVLFVFPLVYFFVIPQMLKQGSLINVSHTPMYERGPLIDFFIGIWKILYYVISIEKFPHLNSALVILIIALIVLIIVCLFIKRNQILTNILISLFIGYLFYYICSSCSFYGYNYWSDYMGTNTIGNRYCLFFIPIIFLFLVIGCKHILELLYKNKIFYKCFHISCLIFSIIYIAIGIINLDYYNWKKDDVREIEKIWSEMKLYNSKTLIHNWDCPSFCFYFIHDENYDCEYNNICLLSSESRIYNENQLEECLFENGYLDLNDFYYIAPINKYAVNFDSFINVVENRDYSVCYLYKGDSVLIHVTRNIN